MSGEPDGEYLEPEAAGTGWPQRILIDLLVVIAVQAVLIWLSQLAAPLLGLWAQVVYLALSPFLTWCVRRSLFVAVLSGLVTLVATLGFLAAIAHWAFGRQC